MQLYSNMAPLTYDVVTVTFKKQTRIPALPTKEVDAPSRREQMAFPVSLQRHEP